MIRRLRFCDGTYFELVLIMSADSASVAGKDELFFKTAAQGNPLSYVYLSR